MKTYAWTTEPIKVTEEQGKRLKMIDEQIHRIEATLDGFQWNAGNATIQKHFDQLETYHRVRRLVLFGDSQVHISLPKPPNLQTPAQANTTVWVETPAQANSPADLQTPAQAKGEPILQTWTTTERGSPVFVVSIKRSKDSIVPHQRRFEMRPEIGGNIKVGAEWKDRKDAIYVTFLDMGLEPPTT